MDEEEDDAHRELLDVAERLRDQMREMQWQAEAPLREMRELAERINAPLRVASELAQKLRDLLPQSRLRRRVAKRIQAIASGDRGAVEEITELAIEALEEREREKRSKPRDSAKRRRVWAKRLGVNVKTIKRHEAIVELSGETVTLDAIRNSRIAGKQRNVATRFRSKKQPE